MTDILIVYHTYGDGPVGRLAQGIRAGAEEVDNTRVRVVPVEEVTEEDLAEADGIAIGSPKEPGHTVSPPIAQLFWKMCEMRDRLDYKVGTAFSGSHGSFGGQELVNQIILRAFLMHNMAVIGQGSPESEGSDFAGGVIVEELDEKSEQWARRLGRRLAEMSALVARGRTT